MNNYTFILILFSVVVVLPLPVIILISSITGWGESGQVTSAEDGQLSEPPDLNYLDFLLYASRMILCLVVVMISTRSVSTTCLTSDVLPQTLKCLPYVQYILLCDSWPTTSH